MVDEEKSVLLQHLKAAALAAVIADKDSAACHICRKPVALEKASADENG
jgi:hypothetical protein